MDSKKGDSSQDLLQDDFDQSIIPMIVKRYLQSISEHEDM
jgi:hypothetical protein